LYLIVPTSCPNVAVGHTAMASCSTRLLHKALFFDTMGAASE
jgi:hypothetical protein